MLGRRMGNFQFSVSYPPG